MGIKRGPAGMKNVEYRILNVEVMMRYCFRSFPLVGM